MELQIKHILSEDEFSQIFRDCRPIFIRIANSYVHDESVAEDITDDSFVKLWEKRGEICTENYKAYTFRIIINKCLDHIKSKQIQNNAKQDIYDTRARLQKYEISSLKSCDPDALFASEVEQIFWQCIYRMPSITREIFIASRFRNKTYSEIAAEMNIPLRQVTSHIQYALKSLRSALKDYMVSIILLLMLLGEALQKETASENRAETHLKADA